MNTITRVTGILVLDTAAAAGGAWVLWNSGGATVTTGSGVVQGALALGLVVAVVFRHALVGRTTVLDRDERAIGIERAVTTGHIVFMTAAIVVWTSTRQYYWGWQLTFAGILLTVTVVLQLLADVTSGRNRAPSDRTERRMLERFFALETWRLTSLTTAVVAIFLTQAVHMWAPAVLNFLILFDAVVVGVALGLRFLLASRTRAALLR